MKVTRPMIERGLAAYHETGNVSPPTLVERILRAALNDPVTDEPYAIPGQTRIDVIDGKTVILGG